MRDKWAKRPAKPKDGFHWRPGKRESCRGRERASRLKFDCGNNVTFLPSV